MTTQLRCSKCDPFEKLSDKSQQKPGRCARGRTAMKAGVVTSSTFFWVGVGGGGRSPVLSTMTTAVRLRLAAPLHNARPKDPHLCFALFKGITGHVYPSCVLKSTDVTRMSPPRYVVHVRKGQILHKPRPGELGVSARIHPVQVHLQVMRPMTETDFMGDVGNRINNK